MKKVLILCTGNSCRSQMTHGWLQSFDKDLYVRSAGTNAAGKLNEGAVAAMAEVGIDISNHTSDSIWVLTTLHTPLVLLKKSIVSLYAFAMR